MKWTRVFFGINEETNDSMPICIDVTMLRAWAAEADDPRIATIDWLDHTRTPGGIEQGVSPTI